MLPLLSDPALYAAAFASVAEKERARASEEPMLPAGPTVTSLGHELGELSERLAALVPFARYETSPVTPRVVLLHGKSRVLFHSPPLDVVVMTALATALSVPLESVFCDSLYSYRRGRSTQQALARTSAYLQAHRRARPDPRSRGLYVVRRDVKAYGDSIPAGPGARLWTALRAALSSCAPWDERLFAWIVRTIRPNVSAAPGLSLSSDRGIPTGSPLQPLMCNLYLGALDQACASVPDALYVRFGDDLLFVHAEPAVAEAAAACVDEQLAALGLSLNQDKSCDMYLTAAGRASEAAPRFRAVTSFKYLGMRIDARGELALSHDKASRLLSAISQRLDTTLPLCAGRDFSVRARLACEVVNAALDAQHATADAAAQLLHQGVRDRGQLADLDHQIALRIAERLSQVRGVRAFRMAPARLLREEYGLVSLVARANRRARAGRRA